MRKWAPLFLFFVLVGCGGQSVFLPAIIDGGEAAAYRTMLSRFPVERPGFGLEVLSGEMEDEPETAALILLAETYRYRATRSGEAQERAVFAAKWLIENADLDGDGVPGWGLASAWDAFADGSVNPRHTIYAVSLATVYEAFAAALGNGVLDAATQQAVKPILAHSLRDSIPKLWKGSHFAYSVMPSDHHFVINASAYFAGTVAALLPFLVDHVPSEVQRTYRSYLDAAVMAVLNETRYADGMPMWTYHSERSDIYPRFRDIPNDLLHHVYTLWGLELYRRAGGAVPLPFTLRDASRAIRDCLKDGRMMLVPQSWPAADQVPGFETIPSNLWGVGSAIGAAAEFGDMALAKTCFKIATRDYGPIDDLREYPLWYQPKESPSYGRSVANVVWGLAWKWTQQ